VKFLDAYNQGGGQGYRRRRHAWYHYNDKTTQPQAGAQQAGRHGQSRSTRAALRLSCRDARSEVWTELDLTRHRVGRVREGQGHDRRQLAVAVGAQDIAGHVEAPRRAWARAMMALGDRGVRLRTAKT